MEKAIILFICFVFGVSCSGLEEKKTSDKSEEKVKTEENNKPKGFCEKIPSQGYGTFIPPKTVHWMYLDDSLKNVCRALNFRLPFMESDIKVIPEMITPEILSLSPIRTFEIISQTKFKKNDSLSFFHYRLKKDNCNCDVMRIYKGKVDSFGFEGFEITEQIVCNAQDDLICCYNSKKIEKVLEENSADDSTKYEMHGHEH